MAKNSRPPTCYLKLNTQIEEKSEKTAKGKPIRGQIVNSYGVSRYDDLEILNERYNRGKKIIFETNTNQEPGSDIR